MSNHTPGPWQCIVGYGNYDLRLETVAGKRIGSVTAFQPPLGLKLGEHRNWDEFPEGRANANLIAAAPNLFDALKGLVEALSNEDDEGLIEHADQMVSARAALAKAQGQT